MLDRETILKVARECYPANALRYEEDVLFGDLSPMIRERGWLKLGELVEIVYWKSRRVVYLARENDANTVRRLTRQAFDLASRGDVESAVQRLIWDGSGGLHGVKTRMASAILTVYDPKVYTMMDERAWASLQELREMGREVYTPKSYAFYLGVCRDLSTTHGVTLRELDRCLFALKGRTAEEVLSLRAGQGGEQ